MLSLPKAESNIPGCSRTASEPDASAAKLTEAYCRSRGQDAGGTITLIRKLSRGTAKTNGHVTACVCQVGNIFISDDEVTACRHVFDVVDEDGSGSIGAAELQKLLNLLRLPATHQQVMRMIAEIDKDGNGEVDFEEFLQVSTSTSLPFRQPVLLTGFCHCKSEHALMLRSTAARGFASLRCNAVCKSWLRT